VDEYDLLEIEFIEASPLIPNPIRKQVGAITKDPQAIPGITPSFEN
jgi:hypothetical protein